MKTEQTRDRSAFDISKFIEEPSLAAINKIQSFCELDGCSDNVPYSSKIELIRIRDGFAKDVLGLSTSHSEQAIQKVCHAMRDAYPVRRTTFLYLLAEFTDTIEGLK